jgi:hypothetical protein
MAGTRAGASGLAPGRYVVAGSNWVLVGAGFGVCLRLTAPVKLLKVARRQRLMLLMVTGPAPDRPPAAAGRHRA